MTFSSISKLPSYCLHYPPNMLSMWIVTRMLMLHERLTKYLLCQAGFTFGNKVNWVQTCRSFSRVGGLLHSKAGPLQRGLHTNFPSFGREIGVGLTSFILIFALSLPNLFGHCSLGGSCPCQNGLGHFF